MTQDRLIIGCGYLGRRVAFAWKSPGTKLYALTRSLEHADELRKQGIEPLIGDVTDPASIPELPAIETVLYAIGLDRKSGRTQREVYVDGLARIVPQLATKSRRVIYISSTSVYSQNAGEWVDEESTCSPTTSSGQVCLDAEQLLRAAIPSAIILRLSGIYGPGRLIGRVDSLRAGTAPEGNPDGWLNLIHVDDAVQAVIACELRGQPSTTYLISDNEPVQRRIFYNTLAQRVGAPLPFAVDATATASSTELNKRCKNRRMREQLGIELNYPSFSEGLAQSLSAE